MGADILQLSALRDQGILSEQEHPQRGESKADWDAVTLIGMPYRICV